MKKGDIIKFGKYPQDNYSFRTPIEWLVLDFNEKTKEALLISRYGLDCQKYHNVPTDITWEYCDLRKWLNNDFIKLAFSEEEVKKIKVSELKNEDNTVYRTRGGNNTKDRIFCLSFNEAEHYFGSDNDRKCKPNAYARKQGVNVYDRNGCCWWWLRSPGDEQRYAKFVNPRGALDLHGFFADFFDDIAVRPALRIIIDEGLETKQREERERREQEDRIRIQSAFQTLSSIGKGAFIKYGNLKMKITQYFEPEVEIRQRIAYSVSALMKLNIISEVITTDNANLLPMHKNKVHMLMTVVSGGFGRRASIRTTQRSFLQAARAVMMAPLSTVLPTPFGPL